MINILLLGLVSFFVDVSTEMVYPLIPLYLTSAFGATPSLVGLIEGIAESLASLLKVVSGMLSDRYKRKKPLAILGYCTSLVYKLALILSTSWLGILTARVIDRFGKGVRTAPRDVLVSENAGECKQGAAFGLHKSLDMAGSALGILLAFWLMKSTTGDFAYKKVFLISAVPAVIGIIILFFVKEKRVPRENKTKKDKITFRALDRRLQYFLLITFLFNLGNSSNAFLLLRAQNVGFKADTVILLYFLYNLTSSLLALPFGKLSDKIGRRKLLVAGYMVFGFVYLGFAFASRQWMMTALFILYGLYTAMTAGVERALIAQIAPPEHKGAVLGLHASLIGIALLPASLIAGMLWDTVAPFAPFVLGGVLAFGAAGSLCMVLKKE